MLVWLSVMVYPQCLRESSDVDTDDPATGACPSSCSVDVDTQLAASEETARRLEEELSAMEEQKNALERIGWQSLSLNSHKSIA